MVINVPSSEDTRDKLVHSNFRLEGSVVKALEKESAKRGVTLSSFVNIALKNYVNCDMLFEELGFVIVSKEFLRKAFNKIREDKDIEEFGRELGLTIVRQYVSYFFPIVNENTLVQYLDLWLSKFGSYKHNINESAYGNTKKHYFVVIHDINMNFSKALRMILEGMLLPIIKKNVEFQNVTVNAVSFSFDVLK